MWSSACDTALWQLSQSSSLAGGGSQDSNLPRVIQPFCLKIYGKYKYKYRTNTGSQESNLPRVIQPFCLKIHGKYKYKYRTNTGSQPGLQLTSRYTTLLFANTERPKIRQEQHRIRNIMSLRSRSRWTIRFGEGFVVPCLCYGPFNTWSRYPIFCNICRLNFPFVVQEMCAQAKFQYQPNFQIPCIRTIFVTQILTFLWSMRTPLKYDINFTSKSCLAMILDGENCTLKLT